MKADFRVFLDACVLANFGVCDLLLRMSERPRLIVPHWSAEVLAEVRRTQVDKLKWPAALADSFQTEIRTAFPNAEIGDYESLLPSLSNHEKDRHVLAAAIRGNCPLVLTFNLKHFPPEALKPWAICASHPQDYLLILYEMEPKQVTGMPRRDRRQAQVGDRGCAHPSGQAVAGVFPAPARRSGGVRPGLTQRRKDCFRPRPPTEKFAPITRIIKMQNVRKVLISIRIGQLI